MRAYHVALSLALAVSVSVASASFCDSAVARKDSLKTRYFSEEGVVKNVSLYWGSGPARAASALLAIILRHELGYQNVRLQQGSLSLQHFAAEVPHSPARNYSEMILAVSTAWEPMHARPWVPNKGDVGGMAGPRLVEYGASSVPVKHQLFVHLADNFRHREQCTNVSQWSFYTNAAALKHCGFVLCHNHVECVVVYKIETDNTTISELQKRTKILQFKELSRSSLLNMLRTGNDSFLFIDYDMWSGYRGVNAVQLPSCISDVSTTCQQELKTAVSIRVGDVYSLVEFAPQLFQVAHNFTPTPENLREILELESEGKLIEQAACEWASKHNTTVDSWVGDYDPSGKIYEMAVFYCIDDPDFKRYDTLLTYLGSFVIPEQYASMFRVRLRRYKTNCYDTNFVKNKITKYMSVGVRQRLIGAVVGGVSNVTDVVTTVDKSSMPMLFYDAAGIDAASTTSTWLTTGRTLHLALALKHFILSMSWTRIAVISEKTATAARFLNDFRFVSDLAIGDHPVKNRLSPSEAEAVMQELQYENARIIFVNTNYKDATTILAAAARLKMNSPKEYAWIVREWRPNNSISDIQHFTISFSCLCGKGIPDSVGLPNLRKEMDQQWPNCTWPVQAAALADAVLTMVHGFKFEVLERPQVRDDVHSAEAIQLFESSLAHTSVQATTQNLTFKGHSVENTLVYVEEWHGSRHELVARWRVDATARSLIVEHQQRAAYPRGDPPHDGKSGCLIHSGDLYMPTCYDFLLGTAIIFIVLAPPTLILAYRFVWHRIKEHQKQFICELLTQRQQRAAALSAGYLVDRSALTLSQEIGSGRFGFVRLAVLRIPGSAPRYVAAKSLRDHQDESEILREACTLASLNHDHIIRLVGVCIDKDPPLVLMEVAFFGDLLQYLRDRRYLAEVVDSVSAQSDEGGEEATHVSAEALTRLARQAASALGYLSLRGVIHRDLRASNCLVDANRSLKLADFGLARETIATGSDGGAEYACRRRGLFPVLWMAPESLVHGVFSAASDVWALGVLFLELVTLGARPFGDMSPLRVMEFVAAGGKPPMPRKATPQTIGLARLCWQREPEQRPTAADVVAYLAERPCALRPALDSEDEPPADADSGFGESPLTELITH